MKLEDLTINQLKKFILSKQLSQNGNKKELCQTILNYVEQKVTQEIQLCWRDTPESQQEEEEQELIQKIQQEIEIWNEPQQDIMDLTDDFQTVRLEQGVESFIKSHEDEKLKILKSYDDLKNKKQNLKERIQQQKQTVSNLPNIIRFIVGQEVSISKSSLEKYPNSVLYTLISSNQFQPNENIHYLNSTAEILMPIFDFIRNQTISDYKLNKEWGFSDRPYFNQHCLGLKYMEFPILDDFPDEYTEFKQILEEEIKKQSDLLDSNFKQYDNQIKKLRELIYDDPIHLNVGGKVFTISKKKLEKHENTYFSPLVSGNWTLENHTHFIDRCFDHFHIIYDYLVTDDIGVYSDDYFKNLTEKNSFLKELDYYQLEAMSTHLVYRFTLTRMIPMHAIDYLRVLYPGKWKLIPKEELTATINKTTVILVRNSIVKYFSKLTKNYIDLSTDQTLRFDCLHSNERGKTELLKVPRFNKLSSQFLRFEIYEKIL